MLTNPKFRKIILATNILTATILIVVVLKENYPTKIYNKLFSEKISQNTNYNATDYSVTDCQYYLKHFDFHYRNETDNPKIIMLGNSLIRWASWDTLLKRNDVINRGISGDRLKCIFERLKYLKNSPTKIVFIEGGINDIP